MHFQIILHYILLHVRCVQIQWCRIMRYLFKIMSLLLSASLILPDCSPSFSLIPILCKMYVHTNSHLSLIELRLKDLLYL